MQVQIIKITIPLSLVTLFLVAIVFISNQTSSMAFSAQDFSYPTTSVDGLAIRNDSTGGDCTLVGNWEPTTKTCTLTTDISVGVNQGNAISIYDNGLTLDGNQHTIDGPGVYGISLVQVNGVTEENLNINNFNTGIIDKYSNSNLLMNNNIAACYTGILVGGENNFIKGNNLPGTVDIGLQLNGNYNVISGNIFSNNKWYGIMLTSDGNAIAHNTLNTSSFFLAGYYNLIIQNKFMNSSAGVGSPSGNNKFCLNLPVGGNYWSTWTAPDNNNDGIVDYPYTFSYPDGQDLEPWTSPNSWPSEDIVVPDVNRYWTWYDSGSMKDWVLMANPADSAQVLSFNLLISGQLKTLSNSFGLGEGRVPAGKTLSAIYPGFVGGPVRAISMSQRAIVSQRSLMGNSFEEVLGTDESKLSDHFFWPWYDQKSMGYKDWILIANPGTEQIIVDVTFTDINGSPVYAENVVLPDENWTPTFPGSMGGPVEVKAYKLGGSWPTDKRNVIASQRVLSNNGSAFNEVPGTPASELSSRYLWTWYDMKSPGFSNWVLIANPNDTPVTYQIKIGGIDQPCGSCTIAPHDKITPTFPGTMDGPLEVTASDRVIASQRIVAGPSFEEVPGYPQIGLATDYHWTWYDMQSTGASNWILIANPNDNDVTYEIKIAGQLMEKGTIPAHNKVTPVFPGIMNGPVQVSTSGPVMASQRVVWNGYFNEVLGAVLN
ncbi:MAG: right-handed parallel beta-helix repeat-containing protein [Actinobacteria bacterium]|nr:right-handed parallel beta-helix repeat-containing protein [Actinomycetota bacterium]